MRSYAILSNNEKKLGAAKVINCVLDRWLVGWLVFVLLTLTLCGLAFEQGRHLISDGWRVRGNNAVNVVAIG